MTAAPAVTILHLSDLHFGRKHRFDRDGFGALLSRVTLDLKERAASDGLVPDVVVVSGDFAEFGKRDEFDQASTFLRGLKAYLGLPARRFVMVPGNHDVNWNKSRAYFEDRAGDGLPAEEPYFRKFEHYKRFFDAFYEGEEGIAFTEDEPWSWFDMPDLGVVVAGMNSAFAESHQDTDHHAFLGERQVRAIAGRMKAFKERGHLRIGVMHHDPFDKRGGAKADQDQKDFRRWLVPSLNLVLHGDIHEETCRYLERDLPAIGVGSAAVGVDERGPDVSNEYQLLVVRANGVERHLRAWVSDQKRWVISPRADASGESGKTFVKADFDAVTALGERTAPAPAVDLAAIVERYRASLARRQGSPTVFDLLGVGENEESGGLDFLRLFVPQTATADRSTAGLRSSGDVGPDADDQDAWTPAMSALLGVPAPSPEDAKREATFLPERSRTVDEIFDLPRLLIVGGPGAGKSALTRGLCLKLSVPGETVHGMPVDTVPVLVELRSFDQAHQAAGPGYTVFDHVARVQADFHGTMAAEHLRTLAAGGRVLWLFDGLDEIADPARRRDMAERIAGLLDEHDRCRVVVTSRIAGVDVARPIFEGAAFQTFRLRDFTAPQRDRFLDAWHDSMFRRDPAVGAQRRQRMAAAIDSTPSLQELCKSPLLCSMLAYLHREESLPRRRHLLYQKVLERMAEHWDANKGLPPRPPHEQFELEDKLMFLRRLAWHMEAGEERAMIAIGRSKLEDFATGFCESRWGQASEIARRRAQSLIGQLYARNGVLTYLGGDTYGFAHRAFLEHLTAAEVVSRLRLGLWTEKDIEQLASERWRDAAWEEVLLLLCGQLQEGDDRGGERVVRLLQSLTRRDPSEILTGQFDYLAFCIKALGELPQLESGIPGELARAINSLILQLVRKYGFKEARLAAAFRRCAGRWPDVEEMFHAVLDHSKAEGQKDVLRLLPCWIAAGGPDLRLSLLLEALGHTSTDAVALCEEAARFGPFSREEVARIVETIHGRSKEDVADILLQVIEYDPEWKEDDPPVLELVAILTHGKSTIARSAAASLLHFLEVHSESASDALVNMTLYGTPEDREIAAIRLSLTDHRHLAIEELGKLAIDREAAFTHLAELALDDPDARRVLQDTLSRAREVADDATVLRLAGAAARAGIWFLSEEDILARCRKLSDASTMLSAIAEFRGSKRADLLRVHGCLEVLRQEPSLASKVWAHCRALTPQRTGQDVLALWKQLLDTSDWSVRLPVAHWAQAAFPGGKVGERAVQVRDAALTIDTPEEVRLIAALMFSPQHPPAKQCLLDLAEHAGNEATRFVAGTMAGRLSVLHDIGARTKSEKLRRRAVEILEIYGEINALLQVGRLRRARVRFEGRDAGTLEELTKVGNGTQFRYDDLYDGPPISPNMPLGEIYKDEHGLLPFFANLLPEGALYEQTARKLGLKRSDKLGVLLRVGADTMGAVEILPMEPA